MLLILSQTFYIIKDGKKNFLQSDLYGHTLFQDKDFWVLYLQDTIQIELDKIHDCQKLNNIKDPKDSKRDIGFGTIFPFSDNMIGFGMSKEILMEIINPLYKEYDLTEEMKKSIEDIIDSKLITPQ